MRLKPSDFPHTLVHSLVLLIYGFCSQYVSGHNQRCTLTVTVLCDSSFQSEPTHPIAEDAGLIRGYWTKDLWNILLPAGNKRSTSCAIQSSF